MDGFPLNQLSLEDEVSKYEVYVLDFSRDADDAMEFWIRNKPNFPSLFSLARALFAVSATSAEAERSFSHTGHELRVKRANMGEAKAARLFYVHDNIKLLTTAE